MRGGGASEGLSFRTVIVSFVLSGFIVGSGVVENVRNGACKWKG